MSLSAFIIKELDGRWFLLWRRVLEWSGAITRKSNQNSEGDDSPANHLGNVPVLTDQLLLLNSQYADSLSGCFVDY